MNRPGWSLLVATILAAAAGLAGGWFAARQTAGGEPPHVHDPAEEHPDEVRIDPEALRALGVTVAAVGSAEFVETVPVPAVVVAPAAAQLRLAAPLGGRVVRVDCMLGATVQAGDALLTLVREPLPLPELTIAGEVVRPAQEALHRMVEELRRAHGELAIARAEYERLAAAAPDGAETPLLPRQLLLARRYELERAERALTFAHHEMERHGIDAARIQAIAAGGELPAFESERWRRALERSGLFGAQAQALLAALPEATRRQPLAVAVASELVASGLAAEELATWLAGEPAAGADFLGVAALLQRGHSLADLRGMHALGALAPVFTLRAPPGGDYDVDAIHVAPSDQVAAGAPLLELGAPRELLLEATPAGGDVEALLAAWRTAAPCTARPAVAGGGPELSGLRVQRVHSRADRAAVGILTLANAPLPGPPDAQRSWQLRAGTPYVLDVPRRSHAQVVVLPQAAVARDGVTDVVFRRTQTGYERVPVEIVARSHGRVAAALGPEAALRPADRVAQAGAFALLLALRGGGEAGHGHQH